MNPKVSMLSSNKSPALVCFPRRKGPTTSAIASVPSHLRPIHVFASPPTTGRTLCGHSLIMEPTQFITSTLAAFWGSHLSVSTRRMRVKAYQSEFHPSVRILTAPPLPAIRSGAARISLTSSFFCQSSIQDNRAASTSTGVSTS